jgi:hypothetical protein
VGLRPLAYWDFGLESRLGHGCLSLVSVVCCQVEVSATSWSLVQRSLNECGVSKKCVIVKPRKMRRSRPPRGCRAIKKNYVIVIQTETQFAHKHSIVGLFVKDISLNASSRSFEAVQLRTQFLWDTGLHSAIDP